MLQLHTGRLMFCLRTALSWDSICRVCSCSRSQPHALNARALPRLCYPDDSTLTSAAKPHGYTERGI